MNSQNQRRGPLERAGGSLEGETLSRLFEAVGDLYQLDVQSVADIPISNSQTSKKVGFVSCQEIWVIKFMPRYILSSRDYETRLRNVSMVSRKLENVVRPLPNSKGEFCSPFDDTHFWISPYVAGRPYDGSDARAEDAAQALCALHSVLRTISDDRSLEFRSSFSFAMQFIELARASASDAEEIDLLARFGNLCRELAIPRRETELEQLLHGDPTIPNFVFSDSGGVACMCDFDDMAYGHSVRDVATLILSTCGLNYLNGTSSLSREISFKFNFEKASKIIDAYRDGMCRPSLEGIWNEVLLVWIEMMCLGLVRRDFIAHDILNGVSTWLACWRRDGNGTLRARFDS